MTVATAVDSLPGVPRRLLEPSAVEASKRIVDPRLTAILRRWQGYSGLLVLGATGEGKSLSLALAARRLAAGRLRGLDLPRVYWFRADELSHGGRDAITQAKRASVAVLDDLGWESKTDVVLRVIGARYDAGKVTAATSGLKFERFRQRYGDAIIRRLVEVGNGELVDLWDLYEQPQPPLGQLPLVVPSRPRMSKTEDLGHQAWIRWVDCYLPLHGRCAGHRDLSMLRSVDDRAIAARVAEGWFDTVRRNPRRAGVARVAAADLMADQVARIREELDIEFAEGKMIAC